MAWFRSIRRVGQRAWSLPVLLILALGATGCTVGIDVQRPASPTTAATATATVRILNTPASTPIASASPTTAAPTATVPAATITPTAISQPTATTTPLAPTATTAPPPATVAPTQVPPPPTATSVPPTAVVQPPARGACAATDLSAQVAWDAGAGSRNGTITITSGIACTLPGFPTVQVQDSQKQALAVTQENEALDAPTAGTSVTLRPGQRAILVVRWSNYCGPSANQPFNLRLVLSNGSGVTPTGGASIPPCLGEAQPSHLGVQPLRLDDPAANVVRDFYDAINNQDYRAAYNLRGADYQAQQPYDDFAAGYKDTALVMALSTDVSATAADRWDISVRIAAEQSDKSIQHFSGTYTVTRENGALKIVAANIAPQ